MTRKRSHVKYFAIYAAGTSLVNPLRDDIGMKSNTGKLGMKQKESKSDDLSSLVLEQTYGKYK